MRVNEKRFFLFGVLFFVLFTWTGCSQNPSAAPKGFQQRWTFRADSTLRALGKGESRIFVTSSRHIYVLNLSGKILWQQALTNDQTYPPLECGNVIVTPFLHTSIAAFARSDGRLLWENVSPFDAQSQAYIVSMACNHDILVVLRWFGPAIAYKLDTGEKVWAYPLSLRARTNVVIHDNLVFLAAMEKGVVVLDLFSGAVQRQIMPSGNVFYIAFNHGLLYTLSMRGKLLYVSVFTPEGKLQQKVLLASSFSSPAMTITDNQIYLCAEQECLALSQNLHIIWRFRAKDSSSFFQSLPVACRQWVFVEDVTHLYILSARQGKLVGSFSLQRAFWEGWFPQRHPPPIVLGDCSLLVVPMKEEILIGYAIP